MQAERGKVVVLNFWATWCVPCRKELPAFGRVYGTIGNKRVAMFAITDEPLDTVKRFAASNPIPIPVLADERRSVIDHHGIVSLPQTFVLDRRLRTIEHFEGEVTEDQLRAAIAKALGDR